MPDALAAVDAGERRQPAVVEVDVGEGDQALVAAAVVPGEHPEVDERQQCVEDRLVAGVDDDAPFELRRGLDVRVRAGEEVGRRKLALVAGDDDPLAAQDGGDGVGGLDLAGLVEDDDVEVLLVGRQQLADDQRAHRPAGLQRGHHLRRGGEQLAHGQVLAFAGGLVADERRLLGLLVLDAGRLLGAQPADALGGRLDVSAVGLLELGDGAAVLLAVERADARVG